MALSASPLNFQGERDRDNVGHQSQMVGLAISTEESLHTNQDRIQIDSVKLNLRQFLQGGTLREGTKPLCPFFPPCPL